MTNYYENYDFDEFPFDEEEELPKTGNSIKSLAPLAIYKVLERETSAKKPLHLNEIVDILAGFPYELSIERKAVGRAVRTMMLLFPEIKYKKGSGAYYDERSPYLAA